MKGNFQEYKGAFGRAFTTGEERTDFGNDAWPNKSEPCWDCGSTIPGHHTELCDMAADGKRDLPSKPGTQYWTGEVKD